jgi:ABC-type phosphate transport system substrate-binding protein
VAGILAGTAFPGGGSQVVVITNKDVPAESLELRDLLDIYTLNIQRWDNGTRITVFDIKGGSKVKDAFYRFLDMKPETMKRVWIAKQFSGKAMPPQTEESEQAIVDHVAQTPGAIAYVSPTTVHGRNDVKIIAEIR